MRKRLVMIALTGVLATGCNGSASMIDGEWKLSSATLRGESIAQPPSDGDMGGASRTITLVIDHGEVSGQGPCNLYGGRLVVMAWEISSGFTDFGIEWGDVFANLAGCNDDLGLIEDAYFEALLQTTGGRRVDGVLTLNGPETILVFKQSP
jgi:hypothetical protein